MWLYLFSVLIFIVLLLWLAYYLGKKSGSNKRKKAVSIEKLTGEMAEKVIFSVPDMIFIVDSNCKIRRVLNCDPEKLSVPVDAIIGLHIYDAVDKNCSEEITAAIQQALDSDEVQEVEYTISFKDSVQYFEGRFKRIQEGLVACFERNITLRKTSEEEISRMQRINQLILDNTNSGLVYVNPDYIVQWENVGRYTDHALASKYKTGCCCYESVMGRTEPCEECVVREALRSRGVEQMELVFDGELCVGITGTPVFNDNGDPQGVVLKFDDMTARRKAAEELRRAKEAAETSDKLKSIFISNMSHEIRTPLNAIVGFSDLLTQTDDPQDKAEFVSVIRRNNELLLQLINDILDLSKIEADMLEFTYSHIDICDLFKDLEVSWSFRADATSNIKLTFLPPAERCVVYTEKNRIQQVLINLMNNAFKFTTEGEIRVGFEQLETGMRFFVSDTGKGIPADKQEEIFNRFVKLDNFVSGTGLGLSICQTILNKLDGEIGVDSTEGVGSTFWFTLPAVSADVTA